MSHASTRARAGFSISSATGSQEASLNRGPASTSASPAFREAPPASGFDFEQAGTFSRSSMPDQGPFGSATQALSTEEAQSTSAFTSTSSGSSGGAFDGGGGMFGAASRPDFGASTPALGSRPFGVGFMPVFDAVPAAGPFGASTPAFGAFPGRLTAVLQFCE